MYTTTQNTFNQAYPLMIQAVLYHGTDIPSRVAPCREISPVMVEVLDPRKRLVTAAGRPVNVAFALAEVLWILQGRNDLQMLQHYNSKIGDYSDDGSTFNAAYGHRLRHHFFVDQLLQVEALLREDPNTRQATLVMSDPRADRAFRSPHVVHSERHDTKDRACNVLSHLMIRDGQLNWLQVVRSNDAMWGTPYNWMQFTHLQEWLATRLGVRVGKFTHTVDSLHIYDYHIEQAKNIEAFDLYDISGAEHTPMEDSSDRVMEIVYQAEHDIRHGLRVEGGQVDDYWMGVLRIFQAHAYYKAGKDSKALFQLLRADKIYGAAQARFYYHHRWHRSPQLHDDMFEHFGPDVGTWITTRFEE